MKKFRQQLRYAGRTLRLNWVAAGWLVPLWGAILVVQGLIPVGTVYLTKPLIDALQAVVGRGMGPETVAALATPVLAMASLLLAAELLKVALQWVGFAQAERIQDLIADLLHAKTTSVDVGSYETPDFLDRLDRVRSGTMSRPIELLEGVGNLVQNVVTILGIGALLISYGGWIAVALLAGTIPTFIVVMRASRQYHEWWTRTTTDRRRTQYFSGLLTGAQTATEMRLFGLGPHFRERFLVLRRMLRGERLALIRRQSISRLGAEGVAMLASVGAMGWMVWQAVLGLATLGDVALFYQAFQRGQGLVRSLFSNVNQLHSNSLFLENLIEFLDLEPTIRAPATPKPFPRRIAGGVRFTDVTFRYPQTERLALDRFNLTVPAGRTVAIVGANGAGKSTLIKLLARFYDPESGRIELDGIDLREADPADLHRQMTIMFQQPVSYQGTVRENIVMGDLLGDASQARIEAAARDAGAHELIAGIPGGYDALLGKSFPGGTELSGGEWQRVAMARAYFRRSPLIVLDEPTSQMDSWSEADWYERFHHLAGDATALIITHRLAIARQADEIHVMEQGRIVESGTHEVLLALHGRYATSWAAQDRASAP